MSYEKSRFKLLHANVSGKEESVAFFLVWFDLFSSPGVIR